MHLRTNISESRLRYSSKRNERCKPKSISHLFYKNHCKNENRAYLGNIASIKLL